ncbi:class I SAM-dependent methyltransferase [Granulicella mallensis]|jgi:SAM-dependent methyltransferase|uniref:Methyltransferase type 11 n=1 Tax=Granulicella mallensis (strain ATCC BAA-1857 / DSM 23137 / MP5ACTX8) TaxID=682795 RepID=G8P1X8_GRAMM|nr:class I SAM-dependent methyltransferase [Granulicella mallensis]AEU37030.1 Methyltransferase type 11 [Granulicella mallensis MP5ACTX8]
MFDLFKKGKDSGGNGTGESSTRHSRGWNDILTLMKASEALRVLDFGATSPANINYLTSLGHSVYMSNIVQDAARPEWLKPAEADAKKGSQPEFDTDAFVAANLDFSQRDFDVILLWDTANYLPPQLVPALFQRLRQVLRPDGSLLAFFHGRLDGPGTAFSRYQLTDSENLIVLNSGNFPVQAVYQTRQIEKFLEGYSRVRFFLGKDNVREVIAIH